MNMQSNKCYKLILNFFRWASLLPLLFVLLLNLFYENHITFDILETSTITANGFKFFLILPITFLLLYGLWKVINYIPEQLLFGILALLYLVGGIYLITHIQMILRYDSGICYWNALNFVKGEFTNLGPGEYFATHVHQLGLATYNGLLILISDRENLIYFVNLFWILLTNFFLWRSMVLLLPERSTVRKLGILLCFLFLPAFFYLFYAYGQVPGMGCLSIALYLSIRFLRKNSIPALGFSLLFLALAFLLRKNYFIAGIALMIVFFIHGLKHRRLSYFLAILGIICAMVLPFRLLHAYYEQAADADLSQTAPASLYIAMGLQECEEPWRANGWYNGFIDTIFTATEYDPKAANELALKSISGSIETFLREPDYMVEFFKEKLITTWCEPTFQSIWSGPIISMNCPTEVEALRNLYSGGSLFRLLAKSMQLLVVFLLFFSLIGVWSSFYQERKNRSMDCCDFLELFCVIHFTGGFLFHLFWETKSQYVYGYVFLLAPVAAKGMDYCFTCLDRQVHKLLSLRSAPKVSNS